MTPRLTTDYAKNYCNRTLIVKVIVENVVTCFYGTQCIMSSGILAPPAQIYRSGHPAGHPKLLQLETPLVLSSNNSDILLDKNNKKCQITIKLICSTQHQLPRK